MRVGENADINGMPVFRSRLHEALGSVFGQNGSRVGAYNGMPKRNQFPYTIKPPEIGRKQIKALIEVCQFTAQFDRKRRYVLRATCTEFGFDPKYERM